MTDRGTAIGVFSGFRATPAVGLGGRHGRGLGPGLAFRQASCRSPPSPISSRPRNPSRSWRISPIEFETVTDRTPVEFRDNAAYALLLERARGKIARRAGRGEPPRCCLCPISGKTPSFIGACRSICSGPPCACSAIQSKLSKTGWIYEASIITPDATRNPSCACSKSAHGAADRPQRLRASGFQRLFPQDLEIPGGRRGRGAPLLVGRIGWEPRETAGADGDNSTLRWSLVAIGVMFVDLPGTVGVSALPAVHRRRLSRRCSRPDLPPKRLMPPALDDWVHSMGSDGDRAMRMTGRQLTRWLGPFRVKQFPISKAQDRIPRYDAP